MTVRPERIRDLRSPGMQPHGNGPIVYWINRDRRVHDNWALLYAQHMAIERNTTLHVVFCLVPEFLDAPLRAYDFMLRGLEELEQACRTYNISFTLLSGSPPISIRTYVEHNQASLLITDFEPLKIKAGWIRTVLDSTSVPFHQVDAHNVVPCWTASSKLEFGAYTLRPKLQRLLPTFLEQFPPLVKHPVAAKPQPPTNWTAVRESLRVNTSVPPVSWITPGEESARTAMKEFLAGLERYEHRNDPTRQGQSGLSPYLHFGQLSAQRLALEVTHIAESEPSLRPAAESFLEELIVRRELSDNYTNYCSAYDSFEGFPAWAQLTLNQHRKDKRDYVYELPEWEQARTHDALWNAAQRQLVRTGKMHGYMRMYWAKKILEWSATPEDALRTAIYLNDVYELDGRDPNGYAGIAWSIGGLHDRAWTERPVYGKIRYMNANGCRRKFDVDSYIASHE